MRKDRRKLLDREQAMIAMLNITGHKLVQTPGASHQTRLYTDARGNTVQVRTSGLSYVAVRKKRSKGSYKYPAWQLNLDATAPKIKSVVVGLFDNETLCAVLEIPARLGLKRKSVLTHRLANSKSFGQFLYGPIAA